MAVKTTTPAPAMSAIAINELAAWSADLVSYLWLGELTRHSDRKFNDQNYFQTEIKALDPIRLPAASASS